MNVGDRHYRTIWPNDDGRSVDIIDQRWLPHAFRVETVGTVEGIATAIRDMWVRGAPLIGVTAAYGVAIQMRDDPSDAALDKRLAQAARDAADGDQSALGAGRDAPRAVAAASGRARRGRLPPRRRDRRRGRRAQPLDRQARPGNHQGDRGAEEARRAGQHPHPLQRRLAGDRRLRHRHRADLSGDRGRHSGPRLCRRNAAPQPGRPAHRLGDGRPRRAAHADRRQCRRPSDAARPGRHGHRRHRPHHRQRRRLQQDRHLSEGARRRTTTACRSMSACRRRPSTGPSTTG